MKDSDLNYMRLALDLAKKGQGRTSPNPCVGAVIVQNGLIVGRGYHRKAGTPHAEVHAIADAREKTHGSTLYVTLEPCNHLGRTPPCTEAILQAGIARVVVGMSDPNPTVAGGGCDFLAGRGLDIVCGVLEEECRRINYPFIKHITSGLPWVVMKAGMSLDAKISYRIGQGGTITGPAATRLTHQLRDSLDAILIGVDTALIDNPSLTTRLPDKGDARDPMRILLDANLRLPSDSALLNQQSDAPTWIFCGPDAPAAHEKILVSAGAVIHRVRQGEDNRLDIREILATLGRAGITSVLVEGGAKIHASMLRLNLVDEVYLLIAPVFVGQQGTSLLNGSISPDAGVVSRLHTVLAQKLEDDILIHGFLNDRVS